MSQSNLTHGQWWSNLDTHLSQTGQCLDLKGLLIKHVWQKFSKLISFVSTNFVIDLALIKQIKGQVHIEIAG